MKMLALFVAFIFLFGCLGGEAPPQENQTNQTPPANQTEPIKIIVGPQQNQTTHANDTVEQPPLPPPPEFEYEYETNATLYVYFINVGSSGLHGNSILVKKGDFDALVDAGPAANSNKVVDFLRSRGVDDIDLLISTNADPRNYGGINAVADNFRIENYWWGDDSFGDSDYSAILDRMAEETKDVKGIRQGFSEEFNGIKFEVLNPAASDAARFDDINNDAIVLRVTDRNFSMLLTSGIQTGAQGQLINQQPSKIKAQVMQAPYYGVGAGTSNIGIFLLTAKPETIIITGSADESAANGGSRDPFRRLMGMSQYGPIPYHEVYNIGTTRITSDGETYAVQGLGN